MPTRLRDQLWLGLTALFLVGIGYYPIILVFYPGLTYEIAKVNGLPSLGAAIFLGTILAVVGTIVGRTKRPATMIFVTLAALFVGLGTMTQIIVQQESAHGWAEQKSIWQQMFTLAPDFVPETTVILLLPEYGDRLGAKPFHAGPWAFGSGLSVLYCGRDLQGFFVYGDLGSLRLTEEGILVPIYNTRVPYDQVVLFQYRRDLDRLELITELPELSGDVQLNSKLGFIRIPVQPTRATAWRWLVQ